MSAEAPPVTESTATSTTPSTTTTDASLSTATKLPVATSTDAKTLVSREVALSGDQLTYLTLMCERYGLGSIDKTARCLVNYSLRDGDHRFIYSTYRCRKCGIKFPKQIKSLALYPHQWAYLDQMQTEYKILDPDLNGKPLRVLLDFTQEGRTKRGMTDAQKGEILDALEKEIFTKIRCNDPVCTHQH